MTCWGLGRTPEMVGAPPKGESKTDPTANVELPPEIPAVPYLMLGLSRAEEIHKELGLTAETNRKTAVGHCRGRRTTLAFKRRTRHEVCG